MRCRQCGGECRQTGANSHKIKEGVYQTTKFYKCNKCGAEQIVTDDPVKV